jgi:hypothetical protein
MPVILYESEVWSAIVREGHRLGELGDRVLRISEPKEEKSNRRLEKIA